jgi:hypothetical protein
MNKLFYILFFSLLGKVSFCQNVSEKIVAALDSFSFLQPQEKVYIQTDRENYVAGEPIWFKTYATLNEKPTVLSKIIYVELINEEGKLVEKRMIKLKSGVSNGVVDTKASYLSGNYFLRAYTLWMQNFPAFIIEKKIKILNTGIKKILSKPTPQEISVAFYPEGGNIIGSLKNIIAFKAINQNNLPIEIKGDILNSKNEKVVSISSIHNGMGKFELEAKEGEIYRAILNTGNGKQKTIILPKVFGDGGVVLSVDNSNPNKTYVSVARTEKNKTIYNELILVAQINYEVVYVAKLNLDEGLDAAAINKKNLPAGIMQISLLSYEGKPLAERIAFVGNYELSKNTIGTTVFNNKARSRNVLSLDLTNYKNLQSAISITNADAEPNELNENIYSAFLLSSDIKGKVHNPAQFFKNKEINTINNLDLVMLTNGWRRYILEDIMSNKFAEIKYPFETGMNIIGKVLQSNGKSNLKEGKINLIINGEDSTKIMSQANTNSNSAFLIENIDFKKEATIYYQGTNLTNKDAIVSVKFEPNFYDTLKYASNRNYNTHNIFENFDNNNFYNLKLADKRREDSLKNITLDAIVLKSKKKSVLDSLNTQYATDLFYESDQTISINTDINTGTIWQFLRNNVPGIVILNSDTGTMVNFARYEGANLFGNSTEAGVQFFLNEVAVNTSVIESLFAEDIGLLKVFKGNSGIALGATRGAIALYTVKGKSTRDWRKKGFDFIKKLGYSVNREFNTLDYNQLKPDANFVDLRTTIYWNPNIVVKDGKALVEFYNDDACKKFKVILEGLDADGKLLHEEKIIE